MFNKLRALFGDRGADQAFTAVRSDANEAGSLIRLEGIEKEYVTEDVHTHAPRDVTLEVARGEFVAVNGPSGSGKSTLLSICGLLDEPSSGTYRLNGQDMSHLNAGARSAVRNRDVAKRHLGAGFEVDDPKVRTLALRLLRRIAVEGQEAAARVESEVVDLVEAALFAAVQGQQSRPEPDRLVCLVETLPVLLRDASGSDEPVARSRGYRCPLDPTAPPAQSLLTRALTAAP